MKYLFVTFALLFLISCESDNTRSEAQRIIDRTIEEAGGDRYLKATVEFKFREHTYKSIRNRGEFHLERSIQDSTGFIRDVVSNTGFQRYLDDQPVAVADTMAKRYLSSVNSVHYFAHLPYALNDMAVNKELAGETEINGEPYYKIGITFQQEGGGEDHHDEFMYWIHKEKYTIDYLAYKFLVNDGGIRFRVAYNPRVIEGIRFVDYRNYTHPNYHTPLKDLDELYLAGELDLLSMIETEVLNVEVR